ncbi:hypothetical protein Tco_0004402 [Tanacetum coccineum]
MTSNNVTFIASFIPLIMEYLVQISKKARILELKRRHLKIIVLTSNTSYPSRKIRRICAYTSLKTTKETRSNTPYVKITRKEARMPCGILDVLDLLRWLLSPSNFWDFPGILRRIYGFERVVEIFVNGIDWRLIEDV